MWRQSKRSNMASITLTSNLKEVVELIEGALESLKDKERLLRPLALEMIPQMTDRIHKQGLASDGTAIGTYSNSYLRTRIANKRGADTKIIMSLTRQLENDWAVIATTNGYGIGFNNPENVAKFGYVEEMKGKDIASLTAAESEFADQVINDILDDAFGF